MMSTDSQLVRVLHHAVENVGLITGSPLNLYLGWCQEAGCDALTSCAVRQVVEELDRSRNRG